MALPLTFRTNIVVFSGDRLFNDPTMRPDYTEALQAQLEESCLFTPMLGVNVALWDEHLGSWTGSCGYKNPKTKERLGVNEIVYIYSITKTFTAVAVLKLVERGELSLDDAASRFVPHLNLSKAITIRHLLNHTSGLPNYTELEDYGPSVSTMPGQPWKEDRILDLIRGRAPDFAPGSGWHYSNTGYFLLKRVIEALSATSFSAAMAQLIIRPLGLENTFVAEDIPSGRLTPGYSRDLNAEKRMENVAGKYHPGWCYAGLMASCVTDVVEFYKQLLLGDLLPDPLLAQLREPVPTGSRDPRFVNPCYGFGVMIDPGSEYGTLIGHSGEGPGYNPWIMHLTDFHGRALTMAIFGNTGPVGIPMLLAHDLLSRIEEVDGSRSQSR